MNRRPIPDRTFQGQKRILHPARQAVSRVQKEEVIGKDLLLKKAMKIKKKAPIKVP